MASLQSGQSILHYRILERIGHGGMGEVYKAEDLKLRRPVAIKRLPADSMRDRMARQRLLREARSASALNHSHIVTIYAIEEAHGLDFIVMEFVSGESLRERISSRGPLEWSQLIEAGSQIADALAAAHSIGLIHRDIKSANVLITERGQVKILDFGLAKLIRPLTDELNTETATIRGDLTESGVVVGTVAYMSPEQTRGEALDPRSDIFSLGVVLYEAATGKLPFGGPSVLSIMHEVAAVEPPPPSTIRRDLPRELDLVIERALAKDKDQRYRSALELMAALSTLKGSTSERSSGLAVPATITEPPSGLEPFVGREMEMRKLVQCLPRVLDGSGLAVFLTGEPGIGKTSLADAFLRRARDAHPALLVCRGRCAEQYGTGEAYLPFLDALSALLARSFHRERISTTLKTYAPTWCLQLPPVFASTAALEQLQRETIGATKDRMLREMGDALGVLAATAPVVLLLEDLQWADPSSVDLLRHLCQRITAQRVLLMGTFRPEDVQRSDHPLKNCIREMQAHHLCEEIALGLLDEKHIVNYLDARFAPNDFPRELAALIQRKTEGHPLFATSLAQFLADCGEITRTNAHWTLGRELAAMTVEVPESVRGMIRRKIEALEDEDRRALQYASVEGDEFTLTLVARLLGADDPAVEERLQRIDRVHRFIKTRGEEEWPDGTLAIRYRFVHSLYQNVLYGDLASTRRVLLHRQAAEHLVEHYGDQAPRIAPQLAMHFERGRDFPHAIEYLIHAGDNAMKVYANAEAEQHYSHALGLIEKVPGANQTEKSVFLYQKRGTVNHVLSRFDRAEEDFKHMLEQARALGSPALEHAALNALANTLSFSHRMDEMLSFATEALRVAEAAGNEALRLETMVFLGFNHMCFGELVEANLLLDEVIRVASAHNYKPALLGGLMWRGAVHMMQSEYDQAEDALTEARTIAAELRDGFMLLVGLFEHSIVQANLGRMSEALRTLNDAIAMARRNGDRFILARLPNCIGWIHRELQDSGHALEHDQSGVELSRENHVLEAEANSLINLGFDYTDKNESEKPLEAFRQVEAIFARDDRMRWRYNIRLRAGQAEYWLAQGNPQQAEDYARRLLETATHHNAHKYVAVAHKLLADAAAARGDLTAADEELKAALNELRDYPAPLAAWKTFAALGRLCLQRGDGREACDAFARAAAIVNQMAANVDDEQLRATFMSSAAVREVVIGSQVT
jgi:tRNA A-37 threonylcarbamoyl transferase component Bud32/tetratricopeptide (TPR) repeat protein